MKTHVHPTGRAFVIGANHRTSGLSVRDRLFVVDANVPEFLNELRQTGLRNGLLLATCDRVEVLGIHSEPEILFSSIIKTFATHAEMPEAELCEILYVREGPAAVRHLFSVTASLESLVIGEPQVFGQVKAAHRMAKDADMVHGAFEGLLQSAYGAAKRVRTETAIGERPVSIASAACGVARSLHGGLERLSVAVIGGGEMGELMARQFKDNGVKALTVSHPNPARITQLANRLECHITPYEKLVGALAEADIVICAMGSRRYSLSVDMVRGALKARRNRPQLIIDTAIPGDVEPAVNRIDDAFLYELSDLERVALEGLTSREAESEAAKVLIEEAVADYLKDHVSRDAVPVLKQLRRHFEATQQTVLDDHSNDAARATELLVSKLLHRPSEVLREMAVNGKTEIKDAERLLRALFNLENTNKENKE
ncbi:MAG: glutamyl-tRNA reductase [Rhodospirillales bacterium]|nr:glutamyl-tRNA reductase [Rhodospirillales bacterium]